LSVDLLLDTVRSVHVREFVPKIAAVLAEILGLGNAPPVLTLWELEDGMRLVATNDEIGSDDSPLLLISIAGENEVVALVSSSEGVTVSVSGGHRTPLQYALAAAAAITFAREFRADINDARNVFGDCEDMTADAMLARLRVGGQNDDLHEAASQIRWGPGM
jgi:hypothetical protein